LLLGISLILASTVAYNGSAVLLAITARRHSKDSSLLIAVARRAPGLIAISITILGWVLEVAALTLIPLTLARILNLAGLGILLGLTRWILKEPLGSREVLGVALIALGIAAASFAPPRFGGTPPGFDEWALLLLVLGSASVFPYILRALHRPVGATVGATAAGLGYALNGILTKGIADAIQPIDVLPVVLFAVGTLLFGLLSFDTELNALRNGYASVVVPVVLAVHTVVPIVCAPLLFGESWPAGLFLRTVLGGGIFFALLGTLILSSASGRVPTKW
jgi:hypothetical protein